MLGDCIDTIYPRVFTEEAKKNGKDKPSSNPFRGRHVEFMPEERTVGGMCSATFGNDHLLSSTQQYNSLKHALDNPYHRFVPYMIRMRNDGYTDITFIEFLVDILLHNKLYRIIIPVLQVALLLLPHNQILVGDVAVTIEDLGDAPEFNPTLTYQLSNNGRPISCEGFPSLFCALRMSQEDGMKSSVY
jgi:hypothetical protein